VSEWCYAIGKIASDFLAGGFSGEVSGKSGRGTAPVVDAGWRSRIPRHPGFVPADGWADKNTV